LYLQPPTIPNVFGKQSTDFYATNPPHHYTPFLLALHLQTASLLFSQAKYPNSVFLSPATLLHHLRTHPLLLLLPQISQVFTTPASESKIHKSLCNCPNKQSNSDPVPTWLLKECSSILLSAITNIVNLSLTSGQFHPTLKKSVISPLLKKPTLDKEELSSYRPISNLSLISKITERVVKSCLMDHLTLTVYSILTSQPTANITLPKQLFCTS